MADQDSNALKGLEKSRLGRDPKPDYDNEDVRKQELRRLQIKAYHSVMKAFSEEYFFVSTVSSSMRRDLTERLIKELNISKETQISVNDKIKEELIGRKQRSDSSSTRSATRSPTTAPASGSSATDVTAPGLSATAVHAPSSSATAIPGSVPSATTVPESGSSLAPATVPSSGASPAPAIVPASDSSPTPATLPASGSSPTTVPSSGNVTAESLIGKYVHIKLSGEAEMEEFVITEYNAEQDKHHIAYADPDTMELNELLRWTELRNFGPEDIKWKDEDKPDFDAYLNQPRA